MYYKFILVITVLVAMTTQLEIEYGVIKNSGEIDCTIRSNGLEVIVKKKSYAPGLWFGLIEYKCGDTIGKAVSLMTCKPCGVYCSYNNQIKGCDQWLVPFIISTFTLSMLLLILIIAFHRYINLASKAIMVSFMRAYYYIIDSRTIKRVKFLNKHTKAEVSARIHETVPIVKSKAARKIEDKRVKRIIKKTKITPTIIRGNDNEYIELPEQPSDKLTQEGPSIGGKVLNTANYNPSAPKIYPDLTQVETNRSGNSRTPSPIRKEKQRKKSSGSSVLQVATLALTASTVIPQTVGCDETLYLHSKGLICKEEVCTELSSTLLTTRTGETICLQDVNGETLKIKMVSSTLKNRYNLVYYTSDFEVDMETYSHCKGRGECWSGGCHKGYKGVNFKTGKYAIEGYTCDSDTVGCDTWCWHQTSCVYVHWWVKSVGARYPVYKRESQIWEVIAETSYKNTTAIHKMNLNNPGVNLGNIGLTNVKNIPLVITNFDTELLIIPDGAITIDGSTAFLNVADTNMPETDKVGDYQIAIQGNSSTYNDHNVVCQANSCKMKCTAPEPKIRRIIRNFQNIMLGQSKQEVYKIGNINVLEATQLVRSTIGLMIGNIEVESLKVIPGRCEIEPVMQFACVSCSQKPYVVLNSYAIKSEGSVIFTSNCTFDTSYLSCNIEPYKLNLLSNSRICTIYIPAFNKTMHVNFEYNFLGVLDVTRSAQAIETTGEVLKDIVSSKGFLDGLTWTFTGFLTVTAISMTVLRVVKAIVMYRVHKDNQNSKV